MAVRLPSFRDLNKITVGIVSMALIAAAVAFAFAVGTLGLLENRYSLTAVFPETGGLRSGNDVRMAGVEIGQVSGVHTDFERGQVIVSFEVDDTVDLGPNTRADVAISTLLGGHYLRLSGPVETPYLADMEPEDRRIPLERTSVPYSVLGALEDTTRTIQALDVDAVNRVVAQLAQTTTANQEEFGNLVTNLGIVAAAINDREVELEGLVANSQQITETLASRDQQLARLIDSATVLLDQLSARREELATLLGSGSHAVAQLADIIAANRAELDNLISDLHVTLEAVDRQLPNINSTFAYAGPTFTGLATVGNHGPWFDVVVTGLGPVGLDLIAGLLGGFLP